jgi:hypothetical protein
VIEFDAGGKPTTLSHPPHIKTDVKMAVDLGLFPESGLAIFEEVFDEVWLSRLPLSGRKKRGRILGPAAW